MSKGYYTLLPERGVLRVQGPDAVEFLLRLITSVFDEDRPVMQFGALLTPQGKYLFDFFVSQIYTDGLILDLARDRIPDLIKKLSMYRLKAKVEFRDMSDEFLVAAMWGEQKQSPELSLVRHPDPRLPAMGWRQIVHSFSPDKFAEEMHTLGFSPATPADYETHRIRLGVPDANKDLKIDGDFPLEGLFDELHGVDFKKGCFIGQETASRMKRRGITRSKIAAFNVEGDAIPPGTEVIAGNVRLGDTRSSIPGRCLALVRLDRLAAADAPVTIAGRVAKSDVAEWIILPPAKADEG